MRKILLVLACGIYAIFVAHETIAAESVPSGVWQSQIQCKPGGVITTRFPRFETDGVKAWLTNYGAYGETYESVWKNNKAKFKGINEGIHEGERYYEKVYATVKILENGDVKISGRRGKRSCKGILRNVPPVAINEFGVKYFPVKIQGCVAVPGSKPFKATRQNLMRYSALRKELRDVTLVSKDKFGVFVVYIGPKLNTLGFMLDSHISKKNDNRKQTRDWSIGNVKFANNQYCRTWDQWPTGKDENCWQVHRAPEDQLYFVCPDTLTYDGDAHTVVSGNVFNARLVGREDCASLYFEKQYTDLGCAVEFDDIKIEF